MMVELFGVLLLLCVVYVDLVSSTRCGHDNVKYDIYRNDHIEPRRSLLSDIDDGQTETSSTNWLLDQIEYYNNLDNPNLETYDNNIDDNILGYKTFASRKNTKPHRHHPSPQAFKHNQHLRYKHNPLINNPLDKIALDIPIKRNVPLTINKQGINMKIPKTIKSDSILLFDDSKPIDHSIWKPFRIHYNTDSLLKIWKDKDEAKHFADNVIPAAMHYLERSLYVRPITGKLKFSRPCQKFVKDKKTNKKHCVQLKYNWQQCGSHVTIPDSDFEETEVCTFDDKTESGVRDCKTMPAGEGHDSDINIYFAGDSDFGCSDVYGYSAYCHSNKYDRPIGGFVNLCEDTLIQENRIFTWEQKVTLVVHEVFHVLGFSSTGFAYFRYNDANRTPRTPRDKNNNNSPMKDPKNGHYMYGSNTIQYHKIRDKFATFIVLPTVVKKAKEFYECSTVLGIELEDFGGHDTAASHWEQRILGYEFMIGYIPPAAPFSLFSFALLEDSGWYKVNWKYASHHPYGRQFGCDWIDKKCLYNHAKDMLDPLTFCTSDIDYGCSKDHVAISNCQLEEYNFKLPKYFQYFTNDNYKPTDPSSPKNNENLGGRLEYADYCPMYYHYNNGDCRFVDASIKHKRFGATITPQSKCIIISHPDHHYLNLRMQGLDGNAIIDKGDASAISSSHISHIPTKLKKGLHHKHHRRKKPLPKELGVCYKQQCFTDSTNKWTGLRIEVNNMQYSESEWITCWKYIDDGKYKITELHEYDIRCPIYDDICYNANPWLCNGHGMLNKTTHECICNAGYIGCDCLYDDTKENRIRYPYSDHHRCQEYNLAKEGVFNKPPTNNIIDKIQNDNVFNNILSDVDINFSEYSLILYNVYIDLDDKNNYITHSKYKDKAYKNFKKEQYNLDFINVAKALKLLIAIPLRIDTKKVWITKYKLEKTDKDVNINDIDKTKKENNENDKYDTHNYYNVYVTLTFVNQQHMDNPEITYSITQIFHHLFEDTVTISRIKTNDEIDDGAKIEYQDDDDTSSTVRISMPQILEHNKANNNNISLFYYLFLFSTISIAWNIAV